MAGEGHCAHSVPTPLTRSKSESRTGRQGTGRHGLCSGVRECTAAQCSQQEELEYVWAVRIFTVVHIVGSSANGAEGRKSAFVETFGRRRRERRIESGNERFGRLCFLFRSLMLVVGAELRSLGQCVADSDCNGIPPCREWRRSIAGRTACRRSRCGTSRAARAPTPPSRTARSSSLRATSRDTRSDQVRSG